MIRERPAGRWLVLAPLIIILFLIQSWSTHRFYTSRFPGANDFYGRWASGCSFFWYGLNPYSEEASLRSQIGMHGRPAEPGEDHAPFFYPLYALFLVAPFCVTQNYPIVQATWMTLMFYVLIGGTVAAMAAARWRPARWLWALTLVWTVLNYPHVRAVLLGQFNLFVFLGIGLALVLSARGRDTLSGMCLALTTVKPQMVVLVVPWLLWWSAHQRRWRHWAGFIVALGTMAGAALLLVPTWPGDFIGQIIRYDELAGTPHHSLTWIVLRHYLGLDPVVEAIVTVGFVVAVLAIIWRFRYARGDTMLWATGMVLLLTNFVAPRVATTGYPALLFALFMLFRQWERAKWGTWAVVGTEIALTAGQWALFFSTVEGNREAAAMYLPFPLVLLVVLLLNRPTCQPEVADD